MHTLSHTDHYQERGGAEGEGVVAGVTSGETRERRERRIGEGGGSG